MYKFYCRFYQSVMRIVSRLLPWREPQLIQGENSLMELPQLIKKHRIKNVLIVTDEGIIQTGLLETLFQKLTEHKLDYTLFSETVPNPTIDNVETAVRLYLDHQCDGIVVIGGGSPIDCAKMVGARIAKRNKPIEKMKGLFKVMKKI